MTSTRPDPLPKTGIAAPDGKPFRYGPIQKIHPIGEYKIVEYLEDLSNVAPADYSRHGKPSYEPWIDGKNLHWSFESLDEALLAAIAFKRVGFADDRRAMMAMHVFNLTTLGVIPDES